MKFILMYSIVIYIVSCADDDDGSHNLLQRIVRSVLWPITITSWFRSGNERLHRMLTILWCILILGWLLSLIYDRIP
jgi:hypothetical protein